MSMCMRHRCSHTHMYGLYNQDHEPIVPARSWALQSLSVMCVRVCVGKVLSRDLTQQLNNAIQFLVHCRPLSISMGNAIKYVKLQASHLLSVAYQLSLHIRGILSPSRSLSAMPSSKSSCRQVIFDLLHIKPHSGRSLPAWAVASSM